MDAANILEWHPGEHGVCSGLLHFWLVAQLGVGESSLSPKQAAIVQSRFLGRRTC